MKKLAFILVLLCFTIASEAQDSIRRHSISASLDVYSAHLWRGAKNGTSISIQPAAEYSYGNFSAGIWLAYSIDRSYTELDLYASYSAGSFTITLYDYFCPPNPVKQFEFFEFTEGKTKHTLDLNVVYAQPEKHPFELLVATMVYGDDLNSETGNNYFSTYIEPAVHFHPWKSDFKIFAGFTPAASYYADQAAFINLGASISYKLKIHRKVVIPVTAKFMYNPVDEKAFFAVGVNL